MDPMGIDRIGELVIMFVDSAILFFPKSLFVELDLDGLYVAFWEELFLISCKNESVTPEDFWFSSFSKELFEVRSIVGK